MTSPILFMGEQADPDLEVLLSRGITRVYVAAPPVGPPRLGCSIAGCPDTTTEDALCEAHVEAWEASPERAAFIRRTETWESATSAFGRRLGLKPKP